MSPQPGWQGLLVYVGIATVRGSPSFRWPVYDLPGGQGTQVGYVIGTGYVPHFRATDDHAWLEITLHDGTKGWIRNDPANVTVELPDPRQVRLVIDPGHGGSETGAQANGLVEKTINFDIAFTKLAPRLLGDRRIHRVWYTRNGDYRVSLQYRWDLANAALPSLFWSIHNNASSNPNARGTETYFKCGSESTPLITSEGRRAACLAHLRTRDQIRRTSCPWVDNGVVCRLVSETDPRSYYYVLQNTNVPAILSETFYISNAGDAACLGSNQFRDWLAQGFYSAITDYLFTSAAGDNCTFRTAYGLSGY